MIENMNKETKELVVRSEKVYNDAQKFVVNSPETYTQSGIELIGIKNQEKRLIELEKTMTKPANETIRAIKAFFEKPKEYLKQAKFIRTNNMANYKMEEDRIKREKEEKLAEEARKKEEELKKKLDLKIEKAKLTGNQDKVDELTYQKDLVKVEVKSVVSKVPYVEGLATRKNWKFRVTDESKIPREYLTIDEVKLGQVARSKHDEVDIPGVEFYFEEGFVGKN